MTGYTSSTPPSAADCEKTQASDRSHFDSANSTAGWLDHESVASSTRGSPQFAESHYAAPQSAPAPAKRTMARIVLMASVFAVGITVGLAAAWWTQRTVPDAHAVTARKPAQVAVTPAARRLPDGRRIAIRGISPSELPYDGAPPPARAPVTPDAFADLSSGASGAAMEEEYVRPVRPSPNAMPGAAQVDRIEPAASPKPTAKTKAAVKPAPDAGDTKTAQKRSNTSRIAKDREIERIKKEADRELQRKLEIGRAVQEERIRKADASRNSRRQLAAAPESREARVRRVLAKCERMRNIFRREQCKWRLCAGMWGKNGCPSYARSSNPNYMY